MRLSEPIDPSGAGGNGYRFAKYHGKLISSQSKSLVTGPFPISTAWSAERVFTSRSSRQLNPPSNLIGHDPLQQAGKRRRGRGVFKK
jgi:hypothetical protein